LLDLLFCVRYVHNAAHFPRCAPRNVSGLNNIMYMYVI
jgi:hypothetical protein